MVRQKRPATELRQSLGDIRSFFAFDNALPTPDTQSDYDDDTIIVMEPSRAARQTNNKRRRVLSHVEIVVPKKQPITPLYVPLSPVKSTEPTPPPVASSSSPNLLNGPTMLSNGRPRRSLKPTNYALIGPEDSDEDMFDAPPSRAANTHSDDEEFHTASQHSDHDDDEDMTEAGHVDSSTTLSISSRSVSVAQSDISTRRSRAKKAADIKPKKTKKKQSSDNADIATGLSPEAAEVTALKKSRAKDRMTNITGGKKEIDQDLPPLSDITDIFADITARALGIGLREAIDGLKNQTLRVATMCSGTESPLLALDMINAALEAQQLNTFRIEHVFSAEIVPFKQAYIDRNFQPPIIFRDIVELITSTDDKATTAYGAKVPIPGGLHILIAGTSCVDFSGLNRLRKGLDENGESGDTFNAVLRYAKTKRPRIVLLENVFNAPWNAMLEAYEAADYVVAGVLVDTKNHYLPQTRQRGYVVCFDRQALGENKNEGKLQKQWTDLMEKLKRPASSPVSSFLLPNDDANVVRTRHVQAKQGLLTDSTKEVDWSRCEMRHVRFRQEKVLGNARPYTDWQESGTLVLPDYADKAWHKRQVERVWDMQDCSVLRKAVLTESKYDVQFKLRIWDLSQNVDRFTDSAPFGVSSCLTPTGIFFVSDRGGPLTYAESLALQGIPLNQINFTTETERQVQDLAGNAMSSTVVGSAIIAALITGLPALSSKKSTEEPNVMKESLDSKPSNIVGLGCLEELMIKSEGAEFDMRLLIEEASQTAQKCACEGQIGTADRPIQTCRDCDHTTCTACGGKPRHNYGLPKHESRKGPEDFVRKWRPFLPMRLRLENTESVLSLLLGNAKSKVSKKNAELEHLKDQYIQAVHDALSAEFRFSHFRRTQHWIIIYEATYSRLELTMDSDRSEWKLFAEPNASLTVNSPLRALLQQPIGRSLVGNSHVLGTTWYWRSPAEVIFKLQIDGDGDALPSWAARLNLPSYENEKVWQYLDIDFTGANSPETRMDVSGRYELLPKCGTACESLYKRVSKDVTPLYFFLDPTRIGNPKNDNFVFSSDPSRKQYDETRDIVARLDAAWRPWDQTREAKCISASADGHWMHDSRSALRVRATTSDVRTHPHLESFMQDPLVQGCSHATAVATCKLHNARDMTSTETDLPLIKADDKSFFQKSSWMTEPLRSSVDYAGWHTLHAQVDLSCTLCAPVLPDIRWKLVKSKQTCAMQPYEEPESATMYEIALKMRPDVFVVKGGPSTVHIGPNVLSLAQRAFAKLQKLTTEGYLGTSWSLDTKYTDASLKSLPAYHLSANDKDKYERKVVLEDLFPKQQQTLAWMRKQEAGEGRSFIFEEAEEASLPHLGWRAEARAKAIGHIRGGILADHPGFGKTVSVLACVKAEFDDNNDNHSSIIKSMKELKIPSTQLAPVKVGATLIICPKTLTQQWFAEVEKFLGRDWAKKHTIKIDTLSNLKKWRRDQFEKAKIILVNQDMLIGEGYQKRLAKFAGMPEPSSSRARDYKTWLDRATQQVHAHVKVLDMKGKRSAGEKVLEAMIDRKFEKHLQDETLRAFVRSKRYRGSEYANKSLADNKDDLPELLKIMKEGKLKAAELKNCVLFEMFHFNRIVVDEFTYLTSKHVATIISLHADKRWILSATPALRDFYDIAQMARLIGMKIRVGGVALGFMSPSNIEAIRSDMTNAELFETFSSVPSHAMVERTHELAQTFLNDFVRRNILEFNEFKYQDHLVPVTLELNHRIVYTELSQQLNSQDMRLKKLRAKNTQNQDRDERLHKAMRDADTPEEALSKNAALFVTRKIESGPRFEALQGKRVVECEGAKAALETAVNKSQVMFVNLDGSDQPFLTWKRAIRKLDSLGDQEVIDTITSMLRVAENENPTTKDDDNNDIATATASPEDDDNVDGITAGEEQEKGTRVNGAYKEMVEQTSKTNQLAKKYAATKRSVRFAENAQRLQASQSKKVVCQMEGCTGDSSNLAVSSVCGHIICQQCFHYTAERLGLCQASGCKSAVKNFHLLWADKIPAAIRKLTKGKQPRKDILDFGNKSLAVVELLRNIRDKDDQAILFVCYEHQVEQVEILLHSHCISCAATHTNPAKVITDFQKNNGAKKTVIILNAGNENASGVNLTNANHVIFFASLLEDSQYKYESQMAQALGRVRRPGQTKPIHVYRMISIDTIDVDILEHRERRRTIITEMDSPVPNVAATAKPERTQLIKDPQTGKFLLVPKSILLSQGATNTTSPNGEIMEGRARVKGYQDFSSLVKFSKAYSEDG